MKCEVCEQEKHCVSIDVEWTLLDWACEECWEKEYNEHYGYNDKPKGKMNCDNDLQIEKLQDLNDKLFKIVGILKRKQEEKELVTVQGYLLEELAEDMRSILMQLRD